MYILYLDESGNEGNPADRFFVLGGLALFERQIYHLTKDLDDLQQRHFPNSEPIPFHMNEMRAGRNFWRNVEYEKRLEILRDVAGVICGSPDYGRRAFAAAIEKSSKLHGDAAVEQATELVVRRFDLLLRRRKAPDRLNDEAKQSQKGLLVFSEGRFDARAKVWVRGFHEKGTQWGALKNLVDLPFFASMRESRLLQAADFVASSVGLYYEKGNDSFLKLILGCFDRGDDDTLHGLVHHRKTGSQQCSCYACESRKAQ